MAKPPDPEKCSFCGKTTRQVNKLIAGKSAYICNECVQTCYSILKAEYEVDASFKKYKLREMNPRTIKAYIDGFVIGQERAKKVLSVAVYNHYKRLESAEDKDDEVEIGKGNILMIGPTGSGKTLMAETLAKLLDVPFTMADATTLTEAGYVGEDVEKIIKNLWIAADRDVELAAKGIVCIDEIDKIISKGGRDGSSRDVGGEGVQQALLKMMESDLVTIPPDGLGLQGDLVQIDTTHILFICTGAFSGLQETIQRRVGQRVIGFDAEFKEQTKGDQNILHRVQSQDLVKYGLIPEFVGRIPVVVAFDEPDEEMLLKILEEPQNSLLKQYQYLFELEEVELSFTPEAKKAIVQRALERKSGARGLRSILEHVMLDIMYELPSMDGVKRCIITRDVVENQSAPILEYHLREKAS